MSGGLASSSMAARVQFDKPLDFVLDGPFVLEPDEIADIRQLAESPAKPASSAALAQLCAAID